MGGWLEIMVSTGFLIAGIVVILTLHVLRASNPEWCVLLLVPARVLR